MRLFPVSGTRVKEKKVGRVSDSGKSSTSHIRVHCTGTAGVTLTDGPSVGVRLWRWHLAIPFSDTGSLTGTCCAGRKSGKIVLRSTVHRTARRSVSSMVPRRAGGEKGGFLVVGSGVSVLSSAHRWEYRRGLFIQHIGSWSRGWAKGREGGMSVCVCRCTVQ